MSTPQQQRVTKLLSALFDYDQKHISTFSGAVRRANELRYPASLDREMNLSNIRFILDKREPLLAAIPQASEEMLSYMEKDLLSTLQYIGYTNTNQSDNPLEFTDPWGLCSSDRNSAADARAMEALAEKQNKLPVAPPGVNIDENIKRAKDMNPVDFYNAVRNGGEWDYKQQGSEYQDFGNFNFGATGKAAGFPEEVLLRGAGWAQEKAGTSDPSWGDPLGKPPYGDDPADQKQIEKGFDYYDTHK